MKVMSSAMVETLDFESLLKEHEWLHQPRLDMVVSPDFDGLLCALLMSEHLSWRLRGFYDGKVLALDAPVQHIRELVFLDVEIYRSQVRSVGNHLLQWDARTELPNFAQVVNPNLLRGITVRQFQRKYPFATVHFLIVLLAHAGISIHAQSGKNFRALLLYPDGTHQALLNYRRNVIDWLRWMGAKKAPSPVQAIFQPLADMTVSEVVHGLERLSGELRAMGFARKDDPCKFDPTDEQQREQAECLREFIQAHTQWSSPPLPKPSWQQTFKTHSTKLNAHNYRQMLAQNPLSFAITSRSRGQGLQFTLVPSHLCWLTD